MPALLSELEDRKKKKQKTRRDEVGERDPRKTYAKAKFVSRLRDSLRPCFTLWTVLLMLSSCRVLESSRDEQEVDRRHAWWLNLNASFFVIRTWPSGLVVKLASWPGQQEVQS